MKTILSLENERITSGKSSPGLNAVLIAEDDPVFRHLLESWLRQWNYRVVAVDNGRDAWKVLQREDSPQMAILDWIMPGVDGVELCRRIRSNVSVPYRYVLLVTAKDKPHDVVAGLDAGADDYLTKPFDVEEFRGRVRAGKRVLELQEALLHAHQALQFQAEHDPLTCLWNRGAIFKVLEREAQRSRRTGEALGVIMADLDHFKEINDTHGHLVGDAVLHEVGCRLATAVRSYDWVGRYGGEEFLIIVPGCDAAGLDASAERLRQAVSESPFETGKGSLAVTLSVGVVSAKPRKLETLDCVALLRAADKALYAAKANGRNRIASVQWDRALGHAGS
jgi:two-component system, cell cycle response regulator